MPKLIAVFITGALLLGIGLPRASAALVTVTTDTSWRSIAPAGNLEGTPIGSVGAAWEAANPGWNSSLLYDDSAANGWHDSVSRGPDMHFNSWIWSEGPQFFGPTPSYFRTSFFVAGIPTSGLLDFIVDDDALIYLNGHLVVNDTNNTATIQHDVDVSAFLLSGTNLIAIKAHDSFPFAGRGANAESFALRLDAEFTPVSAVPEPGSLVVFGAAIVGLIGYRRGLARCPRHP